MSSVPLLVQLRCACQELALRRRVYPHWITQGKMSRAHAEAELAAMAAIVDTLHQLAAAEQSWWPLPDEEACAHVPSLEPVDIQP